MSQSRNLFLLAALLCAAIALPHQAGAGWFSSKKKNKTVLMLGDSITEGYGIKAGNEYPALLQAKVDEAGLPVTIQNAGVSGDTSERGLKRMEWLVKRHPVDILYLEFGVNDVARGVPVKKVRQNFQSIIDIAGAKNPGMKLIIAKVEVAEGFDEEYRADYDRMFRDITRKNNAVLIPSLLEGMHGTELMLRDNIHPSSDGHRKIAAEVWKVLHPMLVELGQP